MESEGISDQSGRSGTTAITFATQFHVISSISSRLSVPNGLRPLTVKSFLWLGYHCAAGNMIFNGRQALLSCSFR